MEEVGTGTLGRTSSMCKGPGDFLEQNTHVKNLKIQLWCLPFRGLNITPVSPLVSRPRS
jgi:hypothetical protein